MKNKVIIVDKNDIEIWSKDRSMITKEDIYRISALWITNYEWEILLAQRALTKKNHPGRFGPAVAWTIEVWETYYTNIVKETQEEIWIKDIKFKEHKKILNNKTYTHFTQWFTATLNKDVSEFEIQEEEVLLLKWISKNELTQDVVNNPEKYIDSMQEAIEMF